MPTIPRRVASSSKRSAIFLAMLIGFCSSCPAQTHDVEISNGIIQATIHPPDPTNGFYRGTRFDWSGVIGSLKYCRS